MGQDATTTVLRSSVLGTVRVFVVLLAGFLASKWPKKEPLLTRESCRSASRICTLLFLPALIISSTGATLNPAALRDSWQLVVSGSLTIALSGVIAWAFGRLLLRPEDRRAFRPVQLAIAFPNSASFPLLLMESLCEQEDINRDYDHDAAECFTQATGMIFIYVVVWQIWFFSWGFYALGGDDTLERKLTGQPARSRSPPLPPATEEGDPCASPCKSSGVLARTEETEGTVGEGSTQKAAADDMVAIDIDVQLDDALMAPSSARPCHREANGVDSAQGGGGGGEGGVGFVGVGGVGGVDGGGGGGKHLVHELPVAAGCAGNGVPPRNQGVTGLPPTGTAPHGISYLAYKRFVPNCWRSKRGNSDNSSSSKAVGASGAAEGGPAASGWARARQRAVLVLVSPNMISVAIGVIIAMISPLQKMLFDNPQAALRPLGAAIETVGTPTVAVSTLVMAGSLVQVATVGDRGATPEGGGDGVHWNRRRFRLLVGALHVGCRLIAVPAVGFALFWVAKTQTSVMGENRLMHLILLIELAMPSAALIIVSLNQVRMPATAGFMAQLYLWQYGSSMFTITFWTALAVRMVY